MAVTPEQMYEVVRELFGAFLEEPKMVETAGRTNVVIRYTFTGPTVKVTINAKADPPVIEYGDTETEPDVSISMTWKVAHEFLMGRANAAELFMKKQINVTPVSQAMKYIKLVPMFLGLLKRYPEIVREKGLEGELEGRSGS